MQANIDDDGNCPNCGQPMRLSESNSESNAAGQAGGGGKAPPSQEGHGPGLAPAAPKEKVQPTPRTDAVAGDNAIECGWVSADFARQLERELRLLPAPVAAALDRIAELERELAEKEQLRRDQVSSMLATERNMQAEIDSLRSATPRSDLQTALDIGLAALGHFNTEQHDKHWNEQERVLREIEKRLRGVARTSGREEQGPR